MDMGIIDELTVLIRKGDLTGAVALVNKWREKYGAERLEALIQGPFMIRMIEDWHRGNLSLAQAYRATKIAEDASGVKLAFSLRPGLPDAWPGEPIAPGPEMVALFLTADGSEAPNRKSAEVALRESEEKFRVLAETSPAVIYVYQGENLVYVNEAAERITGYSREELLKMKFWDIVHPDFRVLVRQRGIARQHGEPVPSRYEVRLITKGGETRWVETNAKRIVYLGKPAGTVTFFDITERKQAEAALREGEEKFRVLAETSSAAIIVFQGVRPVSVNKATEQITGFSKDELLGMKYWETIHPDDREMVRQRSLARQRGETVPSRYEVKLLTKGGEVRWAELTAGRIMYNGMPAGVATLFDITDRKLAEEKARLTKFAVDHFTDSSLWINEKGEIVYVNIATSKALGYSFDELLSMKLWDIDPDYQYEQFIESWNETKRLMARKIESVHRRKDGSEYPVEISINYLKFEDKEYLVTFDRDITQRKQAEEALSEAKARAELYLDLMSHDIRNYNQIAMGFMEMATDTLDLDENENELLSKPIEAIKGSSRLIEHVVKLQKVTDKKALKNRPINLCDILSAVKASYSSITDRKVMIDFSPITECTIVANELIYDVFNNLIGNAIKHSDPHKPLVITIRLKHQTLAGEEYLKISIEDNGPGIPDALKGKLFNRLERGMTRASGRGLGLFLVKTLVEDFGGKVWVEDRVTGDYRKGVRFVVTLPAATELLSH